MPRGLMTANVFERVLAEVAKHLPPIRAAVLYHGGEPFLNKHFLSMARRVKDLGIPLVKTVSNGMLLKQQSMSAVVRSGLDLIQFSIDGADAATNDAVRVRASAERILGSIRLLAEANRNLGGPLKICIITIQFKSPDELSADCEAVPPPWLVDAVRDFPEIFFVPAWAMQWPAWQPGTQFEVAIKHALARPKRCHLLDETLTIRADGTVVVCCYDLLSKSNLGNILRQDLSEIWNGAHAEFSKQFAKGVFQSPCNTCAVVTGRRFLLIKNGLNNQASIPLVNSY